jgi:hypothetical protein
MRDALQAIFRSIVFYNGLWWTSILPGRHPGAPLSSKRILFLLVIFPFFIVLQIIHWLAILLDELLVPAYHRVQIQKPVFISGIPRSGTTFLHRILANDSGYTFFSTWEVLLAPAITEKILIRGLARTDRLIGSPLKKLLNQVVRLISGDLSDIHQVTLSDAEEDYLALLPTVGCFFLTLAFPFSPILRKLGMIDTLSPIHRQQLLDNYHRVLQKHLFTAPSGKILLSKNAAFASWMPYLQSRYDDGRFIVCIRDPFSALSSQLSALNGARAIFGTDPSGEYIATWFTRIFHHNYRVVRRFLQKSDPRQVILIDQGELAHHSADIIRTAIETLNLPLPDALRHSLENLPATAQSAHRHHPPETHTGQAHLKNRMQSDYETILKLPHHIYPQKKENYET